MVPSYLVSSRGRCSLRILIIDDEALVANTLTRLLRGHQVETIAAAKAVEPICQGHHDLILCDIKMPTISGEDLLQRVWERDPSMAKRFVFITGGSFARVPGSLSEHTRVLYKPFDRVLLNELIESVSQEIGEDG